MRVLSFSFLFYFSFLYKGVWGKFSFLFLFSVLYARLASANAVGWGFQQNHVGGFQQKIPILLAFGGARGQQNREKGFQQNFIIFPCILYSYG